VILFLADAGGVASVHAASVMAYGEPLRLHIQQWPNLGLSETSPVDAFVSDSANGMSAIVTGVKTHNGVISQGPDGERGRRDGTPTQTVLEYAEQHGLLTGVVTDRPITDATPAATYAHSNDRGKWGEIFPQAFSPRFGDGVDVLIGSGRTEIAEQMAANGVSYDSLAQAHDRPIYATLEAAPAGNRRPVVVAEEIDVRAATLRALDLLQAGDKGLSAGGGMGRPYRRSARRPAEHRRPGPADRRGAVARRSGRHPDDLHRRPFLRPAGRRRASRPAPAGRL
jgi:alkaline phosphatase